MLQETLSDTQKSRLFTLSCIALTVTAMTFAIRAGILGQLGEQYGFSASELGWIASMAFFGFPLATIFGGILYNALGARTLLYLAFLCHLLGLASTIYADSFVGLMISTFLIGFANGSVEAACNPIVADAYPDNKTTMLNKFHVWFPGGIVIGAIVSFVMTQLEIVWQWQIATMIIPTLIYGGLLINAGFAKPKRELVSSSNNIKELFNPIYLFLAICMVFTATSELGTQQWIEKVLGASGAHPMLVLALVTGIMAIGRYFAGPLVHKFNPIGVLLGSAITTSLGIFLMAQASGPMVYMSAVIFALGVTYFWPTMIGSVAEYAPKTGAIGLSLIGGVGMLAVAGMQPLIGGWVDKAQADAAALGASPEQVAASAGPAILSNMLIFPLILIVAFSVLYIVMRKKLSQNIPQNISNKV